MKDYFGYYGVKYYTGTIVMIKEEYQKEFRSCSRMRFLGYDPDSNKYYFSSMHSIWEQYSMSEYQLSVCISSIANAKYMPTNIEKKMEPRYIDGIVEAWTWYIIVMIFALFINGISNTIMLWIAASIVFFTWRHDKINGK